MSREWRKVNLEQTTEMVNEKVHVDQISINEFISTENLLSNLGGIAPSSGLPSSGKVTSFYKKDVLFSNIRTYFRKVWFADFDGGCSNDVLVFRSDVMDSRFLYYVLADNTFIDFTSKTAKGTKMPRGDKNAIKSYSFNLPPLPEQKAIAHVLGKLDDKIELNRQMNQTLEQMAQALFKSWFVDFDPVIDNAILSGNEIPEALKTKAERRKALLDKNDAVTSSDPATAGVYRDAEQSKNRHPKYNEGFPSSFTYSETLDKWIPEGWEVKKFGDVYTCLDNKRIPLSKPQRDEKKPGLYPYYGATSINDFVNEYIFDGTYLLLGEDGSVMKEDGTPFTQYVWGKMWVNNHAHVLQGANGVTTEHLLNFIKRENVNAFVTGAVQLKINQGNMSRIPFLFSSDLINKEFGLKLDLLYTRLKLCIEETQSLTQLRDTLLPKLISGKVRLPKGFVKKFEGQV